MMTIFHSSRMMLRLLVQRWRYVRQLRRDLERHGSGRILQAVLRGREQEAKNVYKAAKQLIKEYYL